MHEADHAMSSDSNGIAEAKIRQLRRIFRPVQERNGLGAWKFACSNVQAMANSVPLESGRSPEQLLFTFSPRRLGDLLHDVSSLPDGDIKRLIEDRDAMLDEMRHATTSSRR